MIPDFQPGDIWACFGRDWASKAITYRTSVPWAPRRLKLGPSHVAMCCLLHGEPMWIESTTMCRKPCKIRGERVSGCQAHYPADRLFDYVAAGGHVDLYRLVPIDALESHESEKLSRILINEFVAKGVGYDLGGALISGTRIAKRFTFTDLDQVFCSEMLAAALMRLCRLNRENATRFNPAAFMRRVLSDGTYRFVRTFDDVQTTLRLYEGEPCAA